MVPVNINDELDDSQGTFQHSHPDDVSFALETDFESKVTNGLFDKHGVLGVKLVMMHDSGWPDHLYFGPKASVVFVEFKRGGNTLSKRQKFMRSLLRAFGFTVLKASDVDGVNATIAKVTRALNLPSLQAVSAKCKLCGHVDQVVIPWKHAPICRACGKPGMKEFKHA